MSTDTPLSPGLNALKFIGQNMESGQQLKGCLSLKQCQEFLEVIKILTALFTSDEDEKFADQEEVDALVQLTNLCEKMNSSGVFSISGGVMILNALEEISDALNAVKSPTLKFKELKESVKHGKSKK